MAGRPSLRAPSLTPGLPFRLGSRGLQPRAQYGCVGEDCNVAGLQAGAQSCMRRGRAVQRAVAGRCGVSRPQPTRWAHTGLASAHSRSPTCDNDELRKLTDAADLMWREARRPDSYGSDPPEQVKELFAAAKELLDIKGVGTQNAQLLIQAGCGSPLALRARLEEEKIIGDKQRGIEFLQKTIQIRRVDHAESIWEAVAGARPQQAAPERQVTMCVEGNISVGKTTFLRSVCDSSPQLSQKVEVVPEPIEEWKSTQHGDHNLLELFYSDPERYAYIFQMYVFCTRVKQQTRRPPATTGATRPLRLLERSIFSDRHVFAPAPLYCKIRYAYTVRIS